MPDETPPPDPTVPVTMSVAETVTIVGHYLRTIVDVHGQPVLFQVADKLGWTTEKLQQFRDDHAELMMLDAQIAWAEPPEPVLPPSDAELLQPNAEDSELPAIPTDDEIALAVEKADAKLLKGLRSLGLTEREAEEAEALQKFNQEHFKESMDIVSAGVLRTDVKVQVQQREIEERLAFVRKQILSYDEFASDERNGWVREEKMLMAQYLELGQLLVNIQDCWYKGSAQLALIRMRYNQQGGKGGGGRMTQRSNKPGFRPQTLEAEEVTI